MAGHISLVPLTERGSGDVTDLNHLGGIAAGGRGLQTPGFSSPPVFLLGFVGTEV